MPNPKSGNAISINGSAYIPHPQLHINPIPINASSSLEVIIGGMLHLSKPPLHSAGPIRAVTPFLERQGRWCPSRRTLMMVMLLVMFVDCAARVFSVALGKLRLGLLRQLSSFTITMPLVQSQKASKQASKQFLLTSGVITFSRIVAESPKQAMGWLSCIRTTPIPFREASVITSYG